MYLPLHNEQQLLEDLAKGDRISTERIYKQHFKIVSGWVQSYGGDANDAADVFQEGMVILYEKSQQADFRLTCKIGTYLFAVSKYIWFKKIKQQQRQPEFLPESLGSDKGMDPTYENDLNVHYERESHYQLLDTALEQIGEPCKSLLKAFYHEEKTMQMITTEFGYTNTDNAKTQKYKCLNRLRRIFYGEQAKWQ